MVLGRIYTSLTLKGLRNRVNSLRECPIYAKYYWSPSFIIIL